MGSQEDNLLTGARGPNAAAGQEASKRRRGPAAGSRLLRAQVRTGRAGPRGRPCLLSLCTAQSTCCLGPSQRCLSEHVPAEPLAPPVISPFGFGVMRTRWRLLSSGQGPLLGRWRQGLWPTPSWRGLGGGSFVQAGPEAPSVFWDPTQPSTTRAHHGKHRAVCQGTVWQTPSALSLPSSENSVLLQAQPSGRAGPLGRTFEPAAKGKCTMQGSLRTERTGLSDPLSAWGSPPGCIPRTSIAVLLPQ